MRRYDHYLVIYYAIARYKIFNKELLEQLLLLGAPLSRSLVQLLHHLRGCGEETYLVKVSRQIDWGREISSAAFEAVVEHARRLVSVT